MSSVAAKGIAGPAVLPWKTVRASKCTYGRKVAQERIMVAEYPTPATNTTDNERLIIFPGVVGAASEKH